MAGNPLCDWEFTVGVTSPKLGYCKFTALGGGKYCELHLPARLGPSPASWPDLFDILAGGEALDNAPLDEACHDILGTQVKRFLPGERACRLCGGDLAGLRAGETCQTCRHKKRVYLKVLA